MKVIKTNDGYMVEQDNGDYLCDANGDNTWDTHSEAEAVIEIAQGAEPMVLTVDTLDNEAKSAVINIGTNGGYIEAYIDNSYENPRMCINLYNSAGTVFSRESMALSMFTSRSK
jgi:hypothetical protein